MASVGYGEAKRMRIGSYDVIRPLGAGGMSETLLARSPSGRVVVLKRPRNNDAELIARLRDEGRLGSKLFHPNLVETLDLFEHGGLPVLVLGYVEGPTVDELRKKAALPPQAVARIGCQIAEALGTLHEALGDDGQPLRAVHRDVSARNILVTKEGDAVLIDLGIARFDELRAAHTQTGMVLGTLRYMAPELIDGENATPASDFYSLGCVLIEAATGENAFSGAPSEIAASIVSKGPLSGPNASRIEPQLKAVLERCCARQPRQRFQHAHELSSALRKVETALGGGQKVLADRAASHVGALTNPFAAAVSAGPGASPGAMAGASSALGPAPAMVPELANAATERAPKPPVPAPVFGPPPPPANGPISLSAASEPVRPVLAIPAPPAPRPLPTPLADAPSLELDVRERPRVQSHVPLSPQGDWRPQPRRDPGPVIEMAKKVIVFFVIVAAAAIGWRYYSRKQEAEDAKLRDEAAARDAALLKKALESTAVSCSDGYWVYTDAKGTDVVVDSPAKIPKQHKKDARCVRRVR